jgi:two-component system sensor histidine kinase BarA
MSLSRVKVHNSIGFRLSAIIAGIIFLSVAVLSIVNAQQSLDRETETHRELVRGAASAYAASVAEAVSKRDRAVTLSTLRGVRDLPNVVQVDVILSNGEVFAELGSGAWLISSDGHEQSLWRVDHLRVELQIVKSGAEVGRLGMLVDIAPLRAEILRNLGVTLLSALIVSGLGIFIAQFFVSRVTAPIRALTAAMTQFRAGEDNRAADLKARKDEIGILTQSFQDMVDRIAERDQQIAHHVETLEDTVEERTFDLRVAKEEAEAANAAKSDFLATMSHEIRTPMNGMMVMAEMLGAADLTPRHRRYAEIIHRSGNSLLTIINDILDLSKIEAGQLDLEQIPVSPENLVADVASLFWERARGKSLELAIYVSPRVPEEILADPTRLNQIISNLVNNALKFTEQGGVLIRIDADAQTDDQCRMVFEVIDTGIGIPEDKIDHIFESFSQADQSTTRRFGGTGLGLSVCQRLVTAMEGDISVRSKPGHGSTFRVEFPAPVASGAPVRSASGVRTGVNLPDGLVKMAVERMLADLGCELVTENPDVWIASSDLLESHPEPAVVLTDIGDTQADAYLRDGCAVDSLPNPYRRSEIAALVERARTGSFRGAEAVQGNGAKQTLRSFAGLRVLAADDNAVNREVLREALSTLKAEAVFVENGAEAVDAFKASRFDLVFMDGSMPVMDGFEATRQMRAFEAETGAPRTPVYALTARVAGAGDEAWAEAGADGHILKPFTLEKLAEVMSGLRPMQTREMPMNTDPDTSPLLDTATLQTLEKLGGGDRSVRDKVWAMFNDKVAGMLFELHAAMDAGANEDVAAKAHAFKSMALSSGLGGLAAELQRLEDAAKCNDRSIAVIERKTKIDSLIQKSQKEMQSVQSIAG